MEVSSSALPKRGGSENRRDSGKRSIRGKERPLLTSHRHAKTVKYILGPLTDEFDLDLSVKDKPTLCVEDLLALLHYHWCFDTATVPHERYRVQFPLLLLMTAYTSSRPGALIESSCVRGVIELWLAEHWYYHITDYLTKPRINGDSVRFSPSQTSSLANLPFLYITTRQHTHTKYQASTSSLSYVTEGFASES